MVEERFVTSRTHIWTAKADIAYPADLGPIRIVFRILPTKTLDDMVSVCNDIPAIQETDTFFRSFFCD